MSKENVIENLKEDLEGYENEERIDLIEAALKEIEQEENQHVKVKLHKTVLERLLEEQKGFRETIGGDWTLNRTLNEIFKILDSIKKR